MILGNALKVSSYSNIYLLFLGTSITVVVDPQSPKTEDFERQKSLAMELVIALPSTTSLTVYPSNTTSNDKELLLSTITALTIISTKVKNLENLNVKNNGIVIYIHGGVVSTEELVKNFGKLHQSVAVIGTGDKVKELGNAGITVFDFNAVEVSLKFNSIVFFCYRALLLNFCPNCVKSKRLL